MSVDESAVDESPLTVPTRRAVLAGAGVAAVSMLAGCAIYDSTGAPAPAAPAAPAASGDAPKSLTTTAQVPVGGGFVTDQGVVVTQPTEGKFLGFTSVCTHQGCTVSSVKNGLITCPCHGSAFKIADGSVAQGPANKPLAPITVKVVGSDIQRA